MQKYVKSCSGDCIACNHCCKGCQREHYKLAKQIYANPYKAVNNGEIAYNDIHLSQMAQEGLNVTADLPVHPTFLYESLWNVVVLSVLLFMFKRRKFDGQNFLTYISLYGLGRFFIEGLRTDSLYLGNFRISQIVAVITFLIGALSIIYIIKEKNCVVTLPVSSLNDEKTENF